MKDDASVSVGVNLNTGKADKELQRLEQKVLKLQEDLTVGNVVKAVDEVRDGRLACARCADKRNLLTRLCINAYVMQNFFSFFISERYI